VFVPESVRESEEGACEEQRCESERKLKQKADQKAWLQDQVSGESAAGHRPLHVLLDDEADRWDQSQEIWAGRAVSRGPEEKSRNPRQGHEHAENDQVVRPEITVTRSREHLAALGMWDEQDVRQDVRRDPPGAQEAERR
jgi:hypothetical protein